LLWSIVLSCIVNNLTAFIMANWLIHPKLSPKVWPHLNCLPKKVWPLNFPQTSLTLPRTAHVPSTWIMTPTTDKNHRKIMRKISPKIGENFLYFSHDFSRFLSVYIIMFAWVEETLWRKMEFRRNNSSVNHQNLSYCI